MPKYNPISTYRLQFNREFILKDAKSILPYLNKLGIKTIYSSPIFQATYRSTHGYDVINPLRLNPEIGTETDFKAFIEKLGHFKMGLLLDIVPNHMAYSVENPWIYDILERGKGSPYYSFFDIKKNSPYKELRTRLMLPFFGKRLKQLLKDKELFININKTGLTLNYFDSSYPLSIPAYRFVFEAASQRAIPKAVLIYLAATSQKDSFEEARKNLLTDYERTKETKNYINECLAAINNSPEKMKELVRHLYYLPAFWKDTDHKINYRRFFTINSLICVNIQNKEVFETTHKTIKNWVSDDLIQGIRVDHIDGLFNPTEYLTRLRKLTGQDVFIAIEKILEKDESIPTEWPVEGTTGYDFLGLVNNLLTNPEKGPEFYSYYNEWISKDDDFSDVFYRKSRFILYNRLKGELNNLAQACIKIKAFSALELDALKVKFAIGEFLVFCPVYKVYHSPSSFSNSDKKLVSSIFTEVKKKNKASKEVVKALENLFLLKLPGSTNEVLEIDTFFRQCMQFTGPLMAKGIEDTAFYSYNPFICHNEVGDSPGYFGIRTEKFHDYMVKRLEKQPLTMNTISTHDTKRGEDARARLNVLSDIPEKWRKVTRNWRKINRTFKEFKGSVEIPSANDEYLIYQVICAHLPMNGKIDNSFITRLEEYLIKAIREAKVNSSWNDPNEYYENKTLAFVRKILSSESKFPEFLLAFMKELIPHGITNSITQLILKNTSPGVPDTFQGTETWNLSFVDPDNRRPVNYMQLSENLDEILETNNLEQVKSIEDLWQDASNGKIKQWVTWLTLNERIQNEDLFLNGSYIPLKVSGEFRKNIIAFLRHSENSYLLVVLPLSTANLPENFTWENTQIELPETAPQKWINRLDNSHQTIHKTLPVNVVFETLPFGIWVNDNP